MMLFMRPRLYHDHREFELQSLSFELVLTSRLVEKQRVIKKGLEVPPPPFIGGNFEAQTIANYSSPLLEHRNGGSFCASNPFLGGTTMPDVLSLGSGP